MLSPGRFGSLASELTGARGEGERGEGVCEAGGGAQVGLGRRLEEEVRTCFLNCALLCVDTSSGNVVCCVPALVLQCIY